jgi:hypothetical protein
MMRLPSKLRQPPKSLAAEVLFSPETDMRAAQAVATRTVEEAFTLIAGLIDRAEAKRVLQEAVAGLKLPTGRPAKNADNMHLIFEWVIWLKDHRTDPSPMAFCRSYLKRFPGRFAGRKPESLYRTLSGLINKLSIRNIGQNPG